MSIVVAVHDVLQSPVTRTATDIEIRINYIRRDSKIGKYLHWNKDILY